MKTMFSFVIVMIITSIPVCAQYYEPLDLAKKIFSKESIPNIMNYVTGEYKGSPNGRDIQSGPVTKFSLLEQKPGRAVVAMTLIDTAGKGIDTYLYFKKDKIWKMNAFRALAMTGIIEQVKIELEAMTVQQIEEKIEQSKKDKKNAFFTSKADYDFQLGNARLTLELDDNIIKHFLKNQSEFERIKNLALLEHDKMKTIDGKKIDLVKNQEEAYKKLFIDKVSSNSYELGEGINFLIGGILDNTVGYIFVKDKKNLPQMDEGSIIMIKEIGNGWYIYKTT